MRKIITILTGLSIAIECLAVSVARPEVSTTDSAAGAVVTAAESGYIFPEEYPFNSLEVKAILKSEANNEDNHQLLEMTVDVPVAGQLMEILGDNLKTVESLTVTGEINSNDFSTMWNACYYGKLVELDLTDAGVEGNMIPPMALFRINEQVNLTPGHVYCIGLRKLLLPKTVTEIGEMAFSFLIELTELRLPDNLETIGEYAFENCSKLEGEIVFPQSLQYLMRGSFYKSNLQKITLPDSPVSIGMRAFAGCRLIEVYLPDDCNLASGGFQFYGNKLLEKVHLPENLETVPPNIFGECSNLKEVYIPASVKEIREEAFKDSPIVMGPIFPEGLFSIEFNAFKNCQLKEIDLPSTLFELEADAFGCCSSVEKLICRALIPPTNNGRNCIYPLGSPFGDEENFTRGINRDIPVYIPIGTKALYEQNPVWNYFTNFFETDFNEDLSPAGIEKVSEITNSGGEGSTLYDLQGKKVKDSVPGQIYIRDGKKELLAK